jgi:hypothetical protein
MLTFKQAKAEVAALGDEAHYEQTGRFVTTAASAIIDEFSSVNERCALRLAFLDGYDAAADRQVSFDMLGVPMELRA